MALHDQKQFLGFPFINLSVPMLQHLEADAVILPAFVHSRHPKSEGTLKPLEGPGTVFLGLWQFPTTL